MLSSLTNRTVKLSSLPDRTVRLLPHLLCLCQYLGALHPQEGEHGDDGQQGGAGVADDEGQGVVAGDEEDVEHGGGGQVAGQQAGRVGQEAGARLQQRQAQEGKGPHAVENLGAV